MNNEPVWWVSTGDETRRLGGDSGTNVGSGPTTGVRSLKEVQILAAQWLRLYDGLRLHSPCGRRPPAPETIVFPGFALKDNELPSRTKDVALGLT
jgi:hypothetical protein